MVSSTVLITLEFDHNQHFSLFMYHYTPYLIFVTIFDKDVIIIDVSSLTVFLPVCLSLQVSPFCQRCSLQLCLLSSPPRFDIYIFSTTAPPRMFRSSERAGFLSVFSVCLLSKKVRKHQNKNLTETENRVT